jgi:hypothetical protein
LDFSFHVLFLRVTVAALPNSQPFSENAEIPLYFGVLLSPTQLVMGPISAPIITPLESGRILSSSGL